MTKKPYIIGIAGGTCSGKSTAAKQIEAALAPASITIFNMDSYFKSPSPRTIAPITGIEYVEHNHPDTIKLDELYADFEKAIEAKPDYIIIEGLLIFYLERIRKNLDLKIWVDLESDERLVRRIKRHTAAGQSFDDVTNRYLDTVRFRHNELIEPTRWHADVVLNGVLDRGKGIEVILGYIRSL
jgi:uridine kinase